MRAKYLILLLALTALALISSACSENDPEYSFFAEEETVINPPPPEQYAGLANPLTDEPEAIAEGKALFRANCSSCHGITGEGDGPAAGGLEPPPQNLALRQPNLSDSYLYWRIAEGGLMDPFNSLMPGWKGLMNEERIWQVIAYLRTLFPL